MTIHLTKQQSDVSYEDSKTFQMGGRFPSRKSNNFPLDEAGYSAPNAPYGYPMPAPSKYPPLPTHTPQNPRNVGTEKYLPSGAPYQPTFDDSQTFNDYRQNRVDALGYPSASYGYGPDMDQCPQSQPVAPYARGGFSDRQDRYPESVDPRDSRRSSDYPL